MARGYFVDIFSGAGGSALGFLQADFKPVGALDSDKHAVETFESNIKLKPVLTDAQTFNFRKWSKELGDVDVLVGCPPCQGFSKMNLKNQKNGHADSRNDLVKVYIDAVKAIDPKVVVFENVSGMVRRWNGYFKLLTGHLTKLGFKLVWDILNAADYGVPQRRKRLILIGVKKGEPRLPAPTHGNPKSRAVKKGLLKPWVTVKEAIGDLPPIEAGESHPKIPNHRSKKLPENWLRLIRMIPKNGGSRSDAPKELWLPCHRKHRGYDDVFGRLWWDKPSVTLTTGCWDPSKGRFVHPEQDRGLSLRECARLQGFPDDFVFKGPPTSIARQIGNALPPPLARAIAKVVAEYIQ